MIDVRLTARNSTAISQSIEEEDVALILSKMSLFPQLNEMSHRRAAARQRRQTVEFTPIIARRG